MFPFMTLCGTPCTLDNTTNSDFGRAETQTERKYGDPKIMEQKDFRYIVYSLNKYCSVFGVRSNCRSSSENLLTAPTESIPTESAAHNTSKRLSRNEFEYSSSSALEDNAKALRYAKIRREAYEKAYSSHRNRRLAADTVSSALLTTPDTETVIKLAHVHQNTVKQVAPTADTLAHSTLSTHSPARQHLPQTPPATSRTVVATGPTIRTTTIQDVEEERQAARLQLNSAQNSAHKRLQGVLLNRRKPRSFPLSPFSPSAPSIFSPAPSSPLLTSPPAQAQAEAPKVGAETREQRYLRIKQEAYEQVKKLSQNDSSL
jgi:hypothetical protein